MKITHRDNKLYVESKYLIFVRLIYIAIATYLLIEAYLMMSRGYYISRYSSTISLSDDPNTFIVLLVIYLIGGVVISISSFTSIKKLENDKEH